MEETRKLLEAREKYLLQLKDKKEKAFIKAPSGSLRICDNGKRRQYFHRTNPKDVNGKYIPENQMDLARKLAQKDYDSKIIKASEKEISAISKYQSHMPSKCVEQIYESLHPARQVLISPIQETNEQFLKKWLDVKYEGKPFYEEAPEYYTKRGERVRSKSEILIADMLDQAGIPYRYEYPIYLKGLGWIYPDFYVLNIRMRKEIIWEHFGRMDDDNYSENAVSKINHYIKNKIYPGEQLILTYETRKNPLNQKIVKQMITHYLK